MCLFSKHLQLNVILQGRHTDCVRIFLAFSWFVMGQQKYPL